MALDLKKFIAPDDLNALFHKIPHTPENLAFVRAWGKKHKLNLWFRGRGPREVGEITLNYTEPYYPDNNSVNVVTVIKKRGTQYGRHSHHIPLGKSTHFAVYMTKRNARGNMTTHDYVRTLKFKKSQFFKKMLGEEKKKLEMPKTINEFRNTYYRGTAGSVKKVDATRKYGFFGPETAHYVSYHPRTGSAFHTTNARRAKHYAKYGTKSFHWERRHHRKMNESMGFLKGVKYAGKAIVSAAKQTPNIVGMAAGGASRSKIMASPEGHKAINRVIGLHRMTGNKVAANALAKQRKNALRKEETALNELRKDTIANYVVKRFGLGVMPSKSGGYLVPDSRTMRIGGNSSKIHKKVKGAQNNINRAVKRLSTNVEKLSRSHLEPAAIRNGMLNKDYWKYSQEYIRGKYRG